jgi:hypothetical protein
MLWLLNYFLEVYVYIIYYIIFEWYLKKLILQLASVIFKLKKKFKIVFYVYYSHSYTYIYIYIFIYECGDCSLSTL